MTDTIDDVAPKQRRRSRTSSRTSCNGWFGGSSPVRVNHQPAGDLNQVFEPISEPPQSSRAMPASPLPSAPGMRNARPTRDGETAVAAPCTGNRHIDLLRYLWTG